MRRSLVLVTAIALGLAACGGDGATDSSADDASSETAVDAGAGNGSSETSADAPADDDTGTDAGTGDEATDDDGSDDGGDASADGSGPIETCAQLVAGIEGLLADYDSLSTVPTDVAERFDEMSSIILTCSPEQLTFLDSADVNAFLNS